MIYFISLIFLLLSCGVSYNGKENSFFVYSPAFPDGGDIPIKYTCDGGNISIPIKWKNVPEDTKSFVIIMRDYDADGFTHWIVYDVPTSYRELEEGISGNDVNIKEGTNDMGTLGYYGPCPPREDPAHTYTIHLYALNIDSLNLTHDANYDNVVRAMEGKIIKETSYTGKYKAQ